MINLIPNEEKKKMFSDFYTRFAVVLLVMLGISFLLATLVMVPSYLTLMAGENAIEVSIEAQKQKPVSLSDQSILSEVKKLDDKLTLIESRKINEYIFSQRIINEIILKKLSNIKITEISFDSSSSKKATIGISGIAPNRETLLLFQRALEDNPAFSNVDLPISNFIRGTNIKFYMRLNPWSDGDSTQTAS